MYGCETHEEMSLYNSIIIENWRNDLSMVVKISDFKREIDAYLSWARWFSLN